MSEKIPHYKYVVVIGSIVAIVSYLILTAAIPQRFHRLSDQYLEWYFINNPIQAGQLGIHDYDNRLPDYEPENITSRMEDLLVFRSRFESIDQSCLELNDAIDCQVILNAIGKQIFELNELEEWTWNPLLYTEELQLAFEGLINDSYPCPQKQAGYLASRLSAVPDYLLNAGDLLTMVPEIHLEKAREHCSGLKELFTTELDNFKLRLSEEDRSMIGGLQADAVQALIWYEVFLANEISNRPERSFRLGQELYHKKFRYEINESHSIETLESLAWSSLEIIQGEMFDLALPLYQEYFSESPEVTTHRDKLSVIAAVLAHLNDAHPGPDEIFSTVETIVVELQRFISTTEIVPVDPKHRLELRRKPVYHANTSLVEFHTNGYFESDISGVLDVASISKNNSITNLESYLREYNYYALAFLLIHEGIPGHFLQNCFSRKHPSKIRAVFTSETLIEGWAHYCESMLLEAGFNSGNPRYALVEKKWKLRGITNAIIDIGVHNGHMSREEALNLMVDEAFQERAEAELKWERVQLTSTQLCTYFAGYTGIMDLREEFKIQEGRVYGLRRFHELLLAAGPLPVKHLNSLMLEQGD